MKTLEKSRKLSPALASLGIGSDRSNLIAVEQFAAFLFPIPNSALTGSSPEVPPYCFTIGSNSATAAPLALNRVGI